MDRTEALRVAVRLAELVAAEGGRAYFVGGMVRDALLGQESKDIDIEVYGIGREVLIGLLAGLGEPIERGGGFGVWGLRGMELDVALPRTEVRTGNGHSDFRVTSDPYLSFEAATARRDLTVNAMLRDVLSGEVIDVHGGQEDLRDGVIRCVNEDCFAEDALRALRAAQMAARLEGRIEARTLALCRGMDLSVLAPAHAYEETNKALLKAAHPSIYFRELRRMDRLDTFFPELERCIGLEQNPKYHPEGDVFEHTMLVEDAAAALRARAIRPTGFMYAALFHDLGKLVATERKADGRIVAYGHEVLGLELVRTAMHRLTGEKAVIEYVSNMAELHMRPNMLAQAHSKKTKTRVMFDLSVCPEDLILLARADATGKLDEPYDDTNEVFLRERLADYRATLARPMVTGKDLIAAGLRPGPGFAGLLARARRLHMAGLDRDRVLARVLAEAEYVGGNE